MLLLKWRQERILLAYVICLLDGIWQKRGETSMSKKKRKCHGMNKGKRRGKKDKT